MLQCSTWNVARDRVCRCCRSDPSHGQPTRDYHSTVTAGEERDRRRTVKDDSVVPLNDTAVDEFGRWKAPTNLPKKTRWPPCFETHGSSFVLDTRSGMFYESVSDFFYDPKSQLYYGNLQGAYFRYDSTKRSFEAVTSAPTPESTTVDSIAAGASEESSKKTSISIHLKTKVLRSEGSSAQIAKKAKKNKPPKEKASLQDVDATVVIPKKQHAVDIEKWSERQQEIRSIHHPDGKRDSPKAVPTTAKGEPICLLCRRRFPSLEKLRYHETASALHKENLAQATASAAPEKDTPTNASSDAAESAATYVDRAEQRRQMHQYTNPEGQPVANSLFPVEVSTATHESVDSTRNLDESNIGHQMLQKLGWKTGDGLGRVLNAEAGVSLDVPSTLEQDWDRIEALATSAPSRSNRKGIGN